MIFALIFLYSAADNEWRALPMRQGQTEGQFMRLKYQWMFPHSATTQLRNARGELWRELVDDVSLLDEQHEDSLAFTLMMVRLCGCATCQPGSFRLSLGCGTCAYRTVANLKSSDGTLVRRFQSSREEVSTFISLKSLQELPS